MQHNLWNVKSAVLVALSLLNNCSSHWPLGAE